MESCAPPAVPVTALDGDSDGDVVRSPPGEPSQSSPRHRRIHKSLIDREEDQTVRAVLVSMLREDEGWTLGTGAM
jgi:hypothetical protein